LYTVTTVPHMFLLIPEPAIHHGVLLSAVLTSTLAFIIT